MFTTHKQNDPMPQRRGWFHGLQDKITRTFVCCAPPHLLLDDDEIQEILATIEESVKSESEVVSRSSSQNGSFKRRNSASVMPAVQVVDSAADTYVSEEKENKISARTHIKLSAMQRVIITLLALRKAVETRQTERAVVAVQRKWRRRQPTPAGPTRTTEPDLEPDAVDVHTAPLASPTQGVTPNKPTTPEHNPNVTAHEPAEVVLTRTRERTVDLSPFADVERHLDEEVEIKEDDEVFELQNASSSHALLPLLQRCASVPSPPTAVRPQPSKSQVLVDVQAALTIQRGWRTVKAHREREIQRRQQAYEAQKRSVMPRIRDKMIMLRKRLAEMQERHHDDVVFPVIAPMEDDYDWL